MGAAFLVLLGMCSLLVLFTHYWVNNTSNALLLEHIKSIDA